MEFEEAVELLPSLHGIESETMLTLYGLYKVSTIGKCTLPKPSFLDLRSRAKYDRWISISHKTTPEEAKALYISLVVSLKEKLVPRKGWVYVSTIESKPAVDPKDVFDHVKQNNLGYLKTHLDELSLVDKNQMTCLHWACDRRYLDIVQFLVGKIGLDLQDEDGNTALHLAKIAGRDKVVKILLQTGADVQIQNNEGDTFGSL